MSQTTDAVIAELMDRRLLNDVDDGLHQEIAEAVIKAAQPAVDEDGPLSTRDLAMIDQAWENHKAALPVATVINDNQPGRTAIIEITIDPPTLPVGTKLYAGPKMVELAAETSPGDALAMKEDLPKTQEYVLRAMVKNYAVGNSWDCLDAETCTRAADEIKALRAAIDRLDVKAEAKSQEPETVAVKPLEWRNGVAGSCTLIADTILGRYAAWYIEPHGVWRSPTASPGILCGNSLDAAKAAAQADYEQRIRSALIHPTKPEAPAVSVDAIARIIDPVTFAKFDAEIQKDRKAQNICADSFFEYRNVRCRNVFVGLSISSESNGLLTSGSIGNRPGFKNVDLFAVGI